MKIKDHSIKIKEQTRKLAKEQTRKQAAGCSKHCFEVVDGKLRGLKRFSKSIRKNQSPKGVDYEVIVYRNF
ncbi:N-ethylammeline chlorohydrolase [Streptococcus pneumoniae]|uniref:hypothetical protein n=1 Tax=Streptococcus pneumoniae TaxID=1313 RepID=UPI000B719DDA|nr:hypothetical protein [Streptococcus pneumoniae]SNK22116.1 N-ethylammeline chlorohydrolase [Streptococcus pneumoniae]